MTAVSRGTGKESLILTRPWNCGQVEEALVKRFKEHTVYEWLNRSCGRKLCFKFSWKIREARKLIMNNALDEVKLDKVSLNWYVCVCASMCERKIEKNWENKEEKKTERKSESSGGWLGDNNKLWLQMGDCDAQ